MLYKVTVDTFVYIIHGDRVTKLLNLLRAPVFLHFARVLCVIDLLYENL